MKQIINTNPLIIVLLLILVSSCRKASTEVLEKTAIKEVGTELIEKVTKNSVTELSELGLSKEAREFVAKNFDDDLRKQFLKVASENNLVDSIINIAANCLNSAISAEKNNCEQNNRSFIPQNWVKNKSCNAGIMSAIQNYFSFLPTMNKEMDSKLKNGVKIDSKYFSYRVQAED